ncbi:MAG: S-adenosylmethionine decarboxylase, partial [Ectothiorhodospiraceae bacterium]|nr:S-adenosylmethionine decarboxylase [Ectothiorhodospiraceae bacterium]
INSIQNYLSEDTKERYHMIDVNVFQEHMFHTKMLLREPKLRNYLFGESAEDFSEEAKDRIRRPLRREMAEIFYGRNLRPGQEVALGLDFQ